MKKPRRALNVAIATETRAEYWLLRPVYRALDEGGLRPVFLASGQHHLARFGRTINAIRADRVRVRELPTAVAGDEDNPAIRARTVARAAGRYAEALRDFDWLVVLGDRVEMLAAALAATALGVPIGHLHGGEVAPGAHDDAVRHAITKLAHLHFPATAEATRRLRKLGEPAWRIHLAGAPGMDAIRQARLPAKAELDRLVGFDTAEPFALVVQHAAGFSPRQERQHLSGTLQAVADFFRFAVVLGPGLDVGSSLLHAAIKAFMGRRQPGGGCPWAFFPSLDQPVYFGLLSRAAAVVGNSSSGIIESGFFRVPVVDVGPRQAGRLCSCNVVHCDYGRRKVGAAIGRVLHSRLFRRGLARCRNLYGDGHAGRVVAGALARIAIDRRLMVKRITY